MYCGILRQQEAELLNLWTETGTTELYEGMWAGTEGGRDWTGTQQPFTYQVTFSFFPSFKVSSTKPPRWSWMHHDCKPLRSSLRGNMQFRQWRASSWWSSGGHLSSWNVDIIILRHRKTRPASSGFRTCLLWRLPGVFSVKLHLRIRRNRCLMYKSALRWRHSTEQLVLQSRLKSHRWAKSSEAVEKLIKTFPQENTKSA